MSAPDILAAFGVIRVDERFDTAWFTTLSSTALAVAAEWCWWTDSDEAVYSVVERLEAGETLEVRVPTGAVYYFGRVGDEE